MSTDNPLVQQATARTAQQDQQDENTAYMASMYGGRGAYGGPMGGGMDSGYGGGYDPLAAPQYGGVMPNRDFGYERFVSHNLGSTRFDSDNPNIGKAMSGPYQGQTRGQMYESLHGDYAKMSPEQRQPYESRAFEQDVRSPAEKQSQGFQYPSQTAQWGGKGSSWADVRGSGGGQPGGSPMPAPSYANGGAPAAPTARGVGFSMSAVTPMSNVVTAPASPQFAQSMAGQPQAPVYSNQPQTQPSNDFNPGSMNVGALTNGPQYSMSNADGLDPFRGQPSYHQADAIPAGQRYTKVGLGSVANAQQPGAVPFTPRPMGDPNDTARYGPKFSGGGAQPVTSWTAPKPSVTNMSSDAVQAPSYGGVAPPDVTSSFPSFTNAAASPAPPSARFASPSMPPLPPLGSALGMIPVPSYQQPQAPNAERIGQFVGAAPRTAGSVGGGAANLMDQSWQNALDAGATTRHALVGAAPGIGQGVTQGVRGVATAVQQFAQGVGQGFNPNRAPQYTPGGTPPTASRMVTTPIPAPAGASMSVR
jgi:hypothetical protein